jgi:hypothetical protein
MEGTNGRKERQEGKKGRMNGRKKMEGKNERKEADLEEWMEG